MSSQLQRRILVAVVLALLALRCSSESPQATPAGRRNLDAEEAQRGILEAGVGLHQAFLAAGDEPAASASTETMVEIARLAGARQIDLEETSGIYWDVVQARDGGLVSAADARRIADRARTLLARTRSNRH